MPECDSLVAGAGLIGLGIFLLFKSSRGNYQARLVLSLPVRHCGEVQEGFIKIAGRIVSTTNVVSPLLRVPCLVSQVEVAAYLGSGDDAGWKTVHRGTESVPFSVEDETGHVWVDPSNAEFFLSTDVEYSTEKRWKPKPRQLVRFGETKLTAEMLEQRVRQFYEQQSATEANEKKLRFTEKNLMVGDTVTVLGPAYAELPGRSGAGETRIHRVHPDDSFVIGDGTPAEVAARMRRQVGWMRAAGFGCMALGAAMAVSCFFERGG